MIGSTAPALIGAYRRRSVLIGADRRLSARVGADRRLPVHQLSFSSNRILERDVVADGIRDFTIPFRSKRFFMWMSPFA